MGKCLGWEEEREKEDIDGEKVLGGTAGRAEKKLGPTFKKREMPWRADCVGGGRMP